MGSKTIGDFGEDKFKRFVVAIPELDLELPTERREYYRKLITAPDIEYVLDFELVYKQRYLFNFEYLERSLEVYAIGERQNDEFRLFQSSEEMREADPINEELENRIRDLFPELRGEQDSEK